MADAKPSRPDSSKNKKIDGDDFVTKGGEKIVERNGRKCTEKTGANGTVIRVWVDGKKA